MLGSSSRLFMRCVVLTLAVAGPLALSGCGESAAPPTVQVLAQAALSPVSSAPADATRRSLPHAWNSDERSGTWRYTLSFIGSPELAVNGMGLYIPRAGNRFSVDVNGQAVARIGALEDTRADYAQQPHYVFIPGGIVQPGNNVLTVTVSGERARYAGLSHMEIGSADVVRPRYEWRHTLQTKGSFAVVAMALIIACSIAPLAWRLRDTTLVLFTATCFFCALRTSWAVVTVPPMPYHLWTLLTDSAFAGYLLCLAAFCQRAGGLPRQPLNALMLILTLASAAALPVYAFARMAGARQIWLLSMTLFSTLLCALVLRHAWKSRTREASILGLAGAVAVAMGIHDHILVFYTSDGFSSFAVARYSLLVFVLAMGWLVLERLNRRDEQRATVVARLERELLQHREHMEAALNHQQALAASQAQKHERERLLRDVHDGMGLQLQSLLAMVESGELQRSDLLREVRTTIAKMRMILGNSEALPTDGLMLLGQIRYQIERVLRLCQVELRWRCVLDEGQLHLPADKAIALQRLFFELATNVTRHARARCMSVNVSHDPLHPGDVVITVEDDGIGFDVDRVRAGLGLTSIQARCDDLGGRCHFEAAAPVGSRFVLRLSPERSAAVVPILSAASQSQLAS